MMGLAIRNRLQKEREFALEVAVDIPIGLEEIKSAGQFLSPQIHRTPVVSSQTLNALCAGDIRLKCENFQRVGAFKIRGALNRMSQLDSVERERGVVTHSSGNHAQAVALAGKILGVKTHIVMPENAPEVKKAATAGYGAEISFCLATEEARQSATEDLIASYGYTFVPPFDDWGIIQGQGTAALELWQDAGPFDIVLAPVGGGGLLSGTALAAKGFSPSVQVIGVEPSGADDAKRSFDLGVLLKQREPRTIADGLLTSLGQRPFAVVRRYVDQIVLVDDQEIISAMRFAFERLKLVIEPSAAVPLAALLSKKISCAGKKVGVIISGGNVDLSNYFDRLG